VTDGNTPVFPIQTSLGPEAFRIAAWGALRGMLNCLALAKRPSIDSRRRTVVWWILALATVAILGYAVWTYNRLVSLSKRSDAAWSDIDVQLKRRWDLVPALVETVKGYAHHESSTLERVVEARGQAVQPASIAERGVREEGLSAAVGRLFAVAEAYPELKASQNFQELQRNLVEVENTIQYARRYYNAVVRDWNSLVESFPSGWVAAAAGYQERPFFQLDDDAERAAPQVAFGWSSVPGSNREAPPRDPGAPG
jgi:LemA protein